MKCSLSWTLFPVLLALLPCASVFGQTTEPLNGTLAEDSHWKGIVKHRANTGFESSAESELIVTKRDGKSFEARFEGSGGKFVAEVKGTITGTKVIFRPTRIVSYDDSPGLKRILRNYVGLEYRGKIRRNTRTKENLLEAEYHWPDADDASVVRHGRLSLVLQD